MMMFLDEQQTTSMKPEKDGHVLSIGWEVDVQVDIEIADRSVVDCLGGLDTRHG